MAVKFGSLLSHQDLRARGQSCGCVRQADSEAVRQTAAGGFARWTGPLLAGALGDVDVQYVWRFLRSHKIDLAARKSWCESTDPNFTAKAADVVGLYIAPPAKAIVLCVDEKPSIQALERAQGYLKLPNGRALTGQSHDYKRALTRARDLGIVRPRS